MQIFTSIGCIPLCILLVCKRRGYYEAAYYSDSYQLLRAYDVNISGLVSTTMQNEARRLRTERWQAENRERMDEVARFIESHGPLLTKTEIGEMQFKVYARFIRYGSPRPRSVRENNY